MSYYPIVWNVYGNVSRPYTMVMFYLQCQLAMQATWNKLMILWNNYWDLSSTINVTGNSAEIWMLFLSCLDCQVDIPKPCFGLGGGGLASRNRSYCIKSKLAITTITRTWEEKRPLFVVSKIICWHPFISTLMLWKLSWSLWTKQLQNSGICSINLPG